MVNVLFTAAERVQCLCVQWAAAVSAVVLPRCPAVSRSYYVSVFHHHHHHTFNGLFSGTTQVSQYQKGKTNLDFTEARDSEWQWHQLVHLQVCNSLQTDNHASTPPLSLLQAGRPSCHPTNSVKALKALLVSVFADVKKINKC